MITRTQITSETQWHQLRKPNVGASEGAALLNVHEYLTPFSLWARKTGRIAPDPDSAPMKRGRMLERVAVELIAEQFPTWNVERPEAYFSDDQLRLGATPDLFATDPVDGLGVIQIKSVEPGVFRRSWLKDGVMMPPLWIAVQAIIEAHLTDASWAACAALVIGFGIDLHIIKVPKHADIIQRVRDETAHFWHLVETDRAPPPDFGRDASTLKRLLQQDDGTEIDLSTDNEVPEVIAKREQLQEQVKTSQAALDVCNAMLLHKLGTHQVGRLRNGYISAKTIHRKAYEVKASTYRQLRVVIKDEGLQA